MTTSVAATGKSMPLSWVDAAEESSPSSQPTHADVVVLGDGVLGLSIAFALVDSRVERIVASALHQAEETLFARVSSRLPAETVLRLEALIAAGGNDDCQELEGAGGDGLSVLALIRADPGNVSLESMLTEIDKLLAVRSVGLPDGLFADVAPKVLAGGRAQAAVSSPSHLRAHPNPAKTLTLLAALVCCRQREITDTLVGKHLAGVR